MCVKLGARQRLIATICIYLTFFISELAVALRTGSIALTADAFHYLNDLIGFAVALAALIIKERKKPLYGPYTFGWQRAPVVGACFNGAFLVALGVSIFFQSVERFLGTDHVDDPVLVLVMGCVGLALNIISALVLHDHHGHGHCRGQGHGCDPEEVEHPKVPKDSSSVISDGSFEPLHRRLHSNHHHLNRPEGRARRRDLGTLGVLTHVLCDAINNLGVIIAASVMSFTDWGSRFYADQTVSVVISFMIIVSGIPLLKHSGAILLQSAPSGLDAKEVQEDLEMIPGISSVHELHIWQLDENITVASAHLVFEDLDFQKFMNGARRARECLHAYGIHSATLQPELMLSAEEALRCSGKSQKAPCLSVCSGACEDLRCCESLADGGSGGRRTRTGSPLSSTGKDGGTIVETISKVYASKSGKIDCVVSELHRQDEYEL